MNKLIPIEFKDQRVMTTKIIAECYECEERAIKQNYNNHKERFIEGKHFYKLQGKELKEFKREADNIDLAKNINTLYLWTDKGLLRHAKILNNDKAWEVYEELEDTYFKVKESQNNYPQLSKELQAIFVLDERTQKIEKDIKGLEQNIEEIKNDVPLFNIECEQLQNAVRRKGTKLLGGKNSRAYQDRSTRTKVYLDIQSTIKRNFGITSYKALKRKQLDKAIELVNEYKLPIILEDKINELNNQISF